MAKKIMLFLFFAFIMCGAYETVSAKDWAETPTYLTIREFLTLYFNIRFSSSGVTWNIVDFVPSGNPQTAFVFIIQTWEDSGLSERDLRKEIRRCGDSRYSLFKALIGHPDIKKRWDINVIKENFIIKHVRSSDVKEVLAVTVDGVTYFDKDSINRTASMVKFRGGVWSF